MADSYNSQSSYGIKLVVDDVVVASISDNLPYGPNLNLGSDLSIQLDAGSKISVAISLGGERFLDTTASPDGAIVWGVQFNQN